MLLASLTTTWYETVVRVTGDNNAATERALWVSKRGVRLIHCLGPNVSHVQGLAALSTGEGADIGALPKLFVSKPPYRNKLVAS